MNTNKFTDQLGTWFKYIILGGIDICRGSHFKKSTQYTFKNFEKYLIKNHDLEYHNLRSSSTRKQFFINGTNDFNNGIRPQKEGELYIYFLEIDYNFFDKNTCVSDDGSIIFFRTDKINFESDKLLKGNSHDEREKRLKAPEYFNIKLTHHIYSLSKVNIIKQPIYPI